MKFLWTFLILSCMSNKNDVKYSDCVWSGPNNHLSGRIKLDLEHLNPGLRFAIYVELTNHAVDLVALTNQPQIQAAVFDTADNPIPTAVELGSGPKPIQQWAILPYQAYIGLRIDQEGTGYPTKEHREVLLATGGKSWRLKAGQYLLKVRAVFKQQESGPANQWIGELDLPPVKFTVAEQMFTH
jgi:hypothetical protein